MTGITRFLTVAIASLGLLAGCMSANGDTAQDKRQAIHKMKSETLAKLYQIEPGAKKQVEGAIGYAVFSNVGVNLILLSAGSGYGVVEGRGAGGRTYMKMVTGGIGIGLGVKDFRGVFVFTTEAALKGFIENGWDASAQADAAAKAGDKGADKAADKADKADKKDKK